jgi:hypothetical protein
MTTTDDSYLTADRVHHVYGACWRAEGTRNSLQRIEVVGWLLRHTFSIKKLHGYREEIIRMLLSLPAGFRSDVGEGGSVGNMIERGDGVIWSVDMADIEKLVALGIASGLMNFCAPREVWHMLPGGLPYVRVEITMFGVSVN